MASEVEGSALRISFKTPISLMATEGVIVATPSQGWLTRRVVKGIATMCRTPGRHDVSWLDSRMLTSSPWRHVDTVMERSEGDRARLQEM